MKIPGSSSTLVEVLAASLPLLVLQPSGAVAGAMTFFDLSDTVTVTLSSDLVARGSSFICSGETCTVTLVSPFGNNPAGQGANFNSTNIFEPNSQVVSDTIDIEFPNFPTALITFTSDAEGGPGLQPLLAVSMFEDGSVQEAAPGIVWHLAGAADVTDHIFFQSDIESVPEPDTLGLLGLGLIGFGFVRRKHAPKNNQESAVI